MIIVNSDIRSAIQVISLSRRSIGTWEGEGGEGGRFACCTDERTGHRRNEILGLLQGGGVRSGTERGGGVKGSGVGEGGKGVEKLELSGLCHG